MKNKITEEIGRIDATTLERVMESVLSRELILAFAFVYSHSFEVSFVLIGAIARSHDRNKSASRLWGHPVDNILK